MVGRGRGGWLVVVAVVVVVVVVAVIVIVAVVIVFSTVVQHSVSASDQVFRYGCSTPGINTPSD